MARRLNDTHREWARMGAQARLLPDEERRAAFAAFPDVHRGATAAPARASAAGPRRSRRRLTAAARRRMIVGMKRCRARRKAAAPKE